MSGNTRLRTRLKYEEKFLEKYFYGEKFPKKMKNGEPTFERDVKTRNGNIYRLRIYIGPNYPFELPKLVVCDSPKPMPKWEGSHTTHTWHSKDGFLTICFFRPLSWTKKNRLYEVFEKGREWLDAYETHLDTGENMCELLPEMEPTEEEIIKERRLAAPTNAQIERDMLAFYEMFMQAFLTNFMTNGNGEEAPT